MPRPAPHLTLAVAAWIGGFGQRRPAGGPGPHAPGSRCGRPPWI